MDSLFDFFLGLLALESPLFLNGEISRRVGKYEIDSMAPPTSIFVKKIFVCSLTYTSFVMILFYLPSYTIGWLKSAILQKFNPSEKKREYRSNAATFLVAYMLGTPIQEFDLDSGR